MYKPGWKGGRWSALCDRCGFRFHSDELKLEWDGLRVCIDGCWEQRNPQDFLRVPPEEIVPPWTRPEPEDGFLNICYLWARSAYAGLGEAGCMQAGNNLFPYQFLVDLKD